MKKISCMAATLAIAFAAALALSSCDTGTPYFDVTAEKANSAAGGGAGGDVTGNDNTTWDAPASTVLVPNTFVNGTIAEEDGEVWYRINQSADIPVYVWWNDKAYGDDSKTGTVQVTVYNSAGNSILAATTNAWTAPKTINGPTANRTVYLKVEAFNHDKASTGSFAIGYNEIDDTKKPGEPWFPASAPTALAAYTWTSGELVDTTAEELWYSISGSGTFYLWWQDVNGYNTSGDPAPDPKTARIGVSVWDSKAYGVMDKYSWGGYNWGQQIELEAGKPVYVRVDRADTTSTADFGTFSIGYTNVDSFNPDEKWPPANSTLLVRDTWTNGEITDTATEFWYRVEGGSSFNLWWNIRGTTHGDGYKTGDVNVNVYDSDANTVSGGSGWGTSPRVIYPFAGNPVYIRVQRASLTPPTPPDPHPDNGSFGVIYTTIPGTRPWEKLPANAAALTANQWTDGTVTAEGEVWYKIDLARDEQYRVWWNDTDASNTDKTADIVVGAWWPDGTVIFGGTDTSVDSGWNSASQINVLGNNAEYRTAYIRVKARNADESNAGSFGIAYSIGNGSSRPVILPPPSPTALDVDTWTDGTIASGEEQWYSFSVTAGTTYHVWWNGGVYGDGYNKSGTVAAAAWYASSTAIFGETTVINDGWSTAPSFTAATGGTVYVRVTGTNAGTYGIVYNTTGARPATPAFSVTSSTLLNSGVWSTGNVTSGGSVWYRIENATGGEYLWWDDEDNSGIGINPADVRITIRNSNGQVLTSLNDDNGWNASLAITAVGTVYIEVSHYVGYPTGQFAIAYNTSSFTKPSGLWTAPTFGNYTTLSANTWPTSVPNMTATGTQWYRYMAFSTTYLWWVDADSWGVSGYPADVTVTIRNDDGSIIGTADRNTDGWSNYATIPAPTGIYIYLEVKSRAGSSGNYNIVYNSNTTRPSGPPATWTPGGVPTALTAGRWADGNISSGSTDWYSLTASAFQTYYLWWNDYDTSLPAYPGDVQVTVRDSSGNVVNSLQNIDNGTTPQTFSVTTAGTVYIEVTPVGSNYGAYSIVYNTASNKPEVMDSAPTSLSYNSLVAAPSFGSIGDEHWYIINNAYATDYLWVIDQNHDSKGSEAGEITVDIYQGDWTPITPVATGSGGSLATQLAAGTIYVKVTCTAVGDYSIGFNTSNSTKPN